MDHPLSRSPRARLRLRAALAALGGGILLGAAGAYAQAQAPADPGARTAQASGERRHAHDGRRIERRLSRMLDSVKASDDQKSKVGAILKQAFADVRPLQAERRAARSGSLKLLAAPSIDRGAIEAQRAEQARLAEAISKRMTLAFADAAEVLTPEQRSALAQRFERFRGRRHAR